MQIINLSGDAAEESRHFIWTSLMDGLGVLMMEDIAPGSAPVNELIGSSLLLTRADQTPHRTRILNEMLGIFPRRRDDLNEIWAKVVGEPVTNIAEYESICVPTWAAMKAGIINAAEFMDALIEHGWRLADEVPIDGPYSRFCFLLTAAADFPQNIKARDYWAFRAFEPVASVGSKLAVHLGINLEE